jgi:hypothetical protein
LFARDFPEVVKKIAAGGRERRGKTSSLLLPKTVRAGAVRGGAVCTGNIFGVGASGDVHCRAALGPNGHECPFPQNPNSPHDLGPAHFQGLATLAKRLLRLTISLRGGSPEREEENVEVQSALPAESLQAEDAELGMSYEVTGVELVNARARVWTLTKVIFTGAAILRRDKAAYQDTWIELGI